MSNEKKLLPEIIVFAGPNGSGKTTITKLAKVIEPYINADDIKRADFCTDMEAAKKAESLREQSVAMQRGFKKRKDEYFFWENDFWSKDQIERLVGMHEKC